MQDTAKQFDQIITSCRNIFKDKMQDYGPSWRIFRLHGITAIIQSRHGYADSIDMSREKALELYDAIVNETKELMLRKNHDYGEAWRAMSKEGIIDMILAKVIRIKTIIANNGKTIASEGVEGNYFDIINYAIFDLIHYEG